MKYLADTILARVHIAEGYVERTHDGDSQICKEDG